MNKPPPYIREVTTFEIIPENLKAWREYYDISITEAGDQVKNYAFFEMKEIRVEVSDSTMDAIDKLFNEAERRRREKGI